jgi:biopolymer transport protein ExbB
VVEIGPAHVAPILELASTGSGLLPVDTSLGNALRLQLTQVTLVEEYNQGGPVMHPILVLAVATILVSIFKLFEILSIRHPKAGTLQAVIDHLNKNEDAKALEAASSAPGPFGDLLVAGVKHARQEKALLEEVLYERLLAAQPKLERMLAFIALAAGAAPLLGLLGTVTGMIQTFKLITVFGTGDASKLASGISEALLTTKWGLIVAIPALLTHALLARLARGKLSDLEQTSVAFVNGISTEQK